VRSERSDAELLVASRTDAEAFGTFYDRHVAAVLGFFRRRVRDPELSLDLTAETFAAALASLERYVPGDVPARAWLFAIARHKLLDMLRDREVEDRGRRALAMQPLIVDDVGLAVVERVAAEGALTLLDGLPPDQREAIVARYVEDREYKEIGADLRCSSSVVRQRASRGLRALRTALGERDLT
jgi:RNA polymerase sigma factor (sigma-70 family)